MSIAIALNAVTATSATLGLSGYAGADTIDVQLSSRPDFQFAPSPVYNVSAAASAAFTGLNQRATLYARARIRNGSGAGRYGDVLGFRTLDGAARDTTPAAVMIQPAIIVLPEPPVAVFGTGTQSGYPVENLFRDSPVAWRASETSAGVFSFDVQLSGAPLDTIALLNTNAPEDARLRLRFAATRTALDNAATLVDQPFRASANLPGRPGYHAIATFAAVSQIWCRVQVTTSTMTRALFYAEHCILGLNRATKNHALDKKETPGTLGTLDRRRSGVADRIRGLPTRRVEFDLAQLTETQYETKYLELVDAVNEAVLVVPNSKAGAFLHDRILYGALTGGGVTNPSSPRYTRSFVVDSII